MAGRSKIQEIALIVSSRLGGGFGEGLALAQRMLTKFDPSPGDIVLMKRWIRENPLSNSREIEDAFERMFVGPSAGRAPLVMHESSRSRFVEAYRSERDLAESYITSVRDIPSGAKFAGLAVSGLAAGTALRSMARDQSHNKKRQEVKEILRKMGISNPTDEQIDAFLIHKAGRKTRAELHDEQFDMPNSKKSVVASGALSGGVFGAAAGSAIGIQRAKAAMDASGETLASMTNRVGSQIDMIPGRVAAGAVIGALGASLLAGKSWDAQKAKKDADRKKDRKEQARMNESEGLGALEAIRRVSNSVDENEILRKLAGANLTPQQFLELMKVDKNAALGILSRAKSTGAILNARLAALNESGSRFVDAYHAQYRESSPTYQEAGSATDEYIKKMKTGSYGPGENVSRKFSTNKLGQAMRPVQQSIQNAQQAGHYAPQNASRIVSKVVDSGVSTVRNVANNLGNAAGAVGSAVKTAADSPVARRVGAGALGMVGAAALAQKAYQALKNQGVEDPSDDDFYDEMKRSGGMGVDDENLNDYSGGNNLTPGSAPPGYKKVFGRFKKKHPRQ